MKKIIRADIKTFAIINFGIILLSLGVYFFKFPNHFSTGGVSGISILASKLLPGISTATLMMVINLALLVVGFLVLGKSFGFLTAYCSLMFSGETWLLEFLYPMTSPLTSQPLLELMFAMLLPAVGSALLFNFGASSGGTDIVAMILKKFTHINIGMALFVSDSLIAASACLLFGMETGLFSILGLILKAFVVDFVIEGVNMCKCFSIITTKSTEISLYIISELNHSATIVDAVGAYSNENKKMIITACKRSEAVKLRRYCKNVDHTAFMFITNTSEIIGKGFRNV